jgi:hypothetical protein
MYAGVGANVADAKTGLSGSPQAGQRLSAASHPETYMQRGKAAHLFGCAAALRFDKPSEVLWPPVSQSRVKLHPDIIDARMKLMAVRTDCVGKRSRRRKHFGSI